MGLPCHPVFAKYLIHREGFTLALTFSGPALIGCGEHLRSGGRGRVGKISADHKR